MTKLPTPEQWIIHEMNEMEMAEEIEKHIDYVDEKAVPSICRCNSFVIS